MSDSWLPSTDYPGLTNERLVIIGHIIRVAREGAADDHHPEAGETNWSLGVRGYERTCYAITWAQLDYPWLVVVAGAQGGPVHFVMTIGGHPVRFYRGDPEDVPQRYRQRSIPEIIEQQRALALDPALPTGQCLRIAIENGANGRPANIYLAEMDEETGEINQSRVYVVPSVATATTVVDFAPPIEPVEIPPVTAEALDQESAQNAEGTKTGSDDE